MSAAESLQKRLETDADRIASARVIAKALVDARLKEKEMPEVGGKKLAGEFGAMLADVRKKIDEAKLGIAGAITELVTEVQSGKQIESALREETATIRKAFGELLGNGPPQAPQQSKTEPPKTT